MRLHPLQLWASGRAGQRAPMTASFEYTCAISCRTHPVWAASAQLWAAPRTPHLGPDCKRPGQRLRRTNWRSETLEGEGVDSPPSSRTPFLPHLFDRNIFPRFRSPTTRSKSDCLLESPRRNAAVGSRPFQLWAGGSVLPGAEIVAPARGGEPTGDRGAACLPPLAADPRDRDRDQSIGLRSIHWSMLERWPIPS